MQMGQKGKNVIFAFLCISEHFKSIGTYFFSKIFVSAKRKMQAGARAIMLCQTVRLATAIFLLTNSVITTPVSVIEVRCNYHKVPRYNPIRRFQWPRWWWPALAREVTCVYFVQLFATHLDVALVICTSNIIILSFQYQLKQSDQKREWLGWTMC